MPFSKKTWYDGMGGGTPITADELNRMETGIGAAVAFADAAPATYSQRAKTDAMARLYGGLAARKAAPCRIAGLGSSTMEGIGADTTSLGFFALLIRRLQAAYPSGTGNEANIAFDQQGAWTANTAVGVQGYNAGQGGTTSATYAGSTRTANIAALNPSAVIHMIGSNDYFSGIAPATYKANVTAAIAAFKAISTTRPVVHLLVHAHQRFDAVAGTYPWSAYGAALAEIAAADPLNVAFLDLSGVFALNGVPGADPLALTESTHVHLTTAGHALMADQLAQELNTPSTTTASPSSGAGSLLAYDSFNRADAATLGSADSGQAWVNAGTTWSVASGRATSGGNGHTGFDVGRADVDVSVDQVYSGGSTNMGINFNYGDSNNRLCWYLDGAGNPNLVKIDGGALSTLATGSAVSVASGQRRTLRAVSKGSTITCYIDGTQAATYTLTAAETTKYKALTQAGLRQAAAAAVSFDNFLVKVPA